MFAIIVVLEFPPSESCRPTGVQVQLNVTRLLFGLHKPTMHNA